MLSSEIETPRTLIQRLSGKLLPKKTTIRAPLVGYVSFGSNGNQAKLKALPSKAPLVAPFFESWEALLTWAMKTELVLSGFVVNSEGFIIAIAGTEAISKCDGLGADLCLFFDEMRSSNPAGGELRSVCLMFDNHWLLGLQSGRDRTATVGLIATTLDPQLIDTILQGMTQSQENLI